MDKTKVALFTVSVLLLGQETAIAFPNCNNPDLGFCVHDVHGVLVGPLIQQGLVGRLYNGKPYGINQTRWGIGPYASFGFTSHDCTTGKYIVGDYSVTQPPYAVSDGVNLWTTESNEVTTVELHSYNWYTQNLDTGVITEGCNEYPSPIYNPGGHWITEVSVPVLLDTHINRFVSPFSVR